MQFMKCQMHHIRARQFDEISVFFSRKIAAPISRIILDNVSMQQWRAEMMRMTMHQNAQTYDATMHACDA